MANEEADLYLTELRKLRGAAKDPDVVRALSGEIEKLERARSLAELREIQSVVKNPHVLSLLSSEIEKLEKVISPLSVSVVPSLIFLVSVNNCDWITETGGGLGFGPRSGSEERDADVGE
ncbi:hypothetical protein QJS10_CPB17g02021 [Acorus calamus]|uniref:Uncharacterized protein n=1 Tax=Acorus calamus TaxID=4465 RepID=A0AAV9CSR2_ACOCL|nr:hypothetical protein QJS10_CPB17g02021 [Acorus calamus]